MARYFFNQCLVAFQLGVIILRLMANNTHKPLGCLVQKVPKTHYTLTNATKSLYNI